jgi:alkanesulfonate monooxygenase SsuD/methylene tetrahydromethanopterin reductase-like flavin-dependent oxidoreductase (luciferase family)
MSEKTHRVNLGILLVGTPNSSFKLPSLSKLGKHVEQAGFHRVGISDHLIASHVETFDPIVCLATLCESTSQIRVAVQVMVVPLRHPVQIAHAFTSLDILSNGRIELGVGVGGEWPAEFESMGIDIRSRGDRTDESLEIITSLWRGDCVNFDGKHFQIKGLQSRSLPIQTPFPPIVIGGRSDRALNRAAKVGNRWDGIFLTPDKFSSLKSRLDELSKISMRNVGSGMVIWACVGKKKQAQESLAQAMQSFYQVPFERFERFTITGSQEEVKERIADFVQRGASDISIIPVGDFESQIDILGEINQSLKNDSL